ncbi:acyltransferase family protein [Rhodoblastus sp.]|uniref:acyltransferase family protein n=1 Tax=Rhodoblastus sp. TaxID=1962975 RepID=UPI003F9D7D59
MENISIHKRGDGHYQSRYRPDIDGLRALAVTLVIVFHLAPRLLPNGFIGVDIFFVISGYVVTLSVMRRASDSIVDSMFSFWKRRLVRIYPALLVCILATMIVCIFLMPPFPASTHIGVFRVGLAAAVGVANLYLLHSRQNYFTADQSFDPFLHTWSLGIEEQFYVLFSLSFLAAPPLVAALLGARDSSKVKWSRIWLMAVLTLASAILLASASRNDELETYYLLQFRFWELGVGSLLAIWTVSDGRYGHFRAPYLARQFASVLALAVIASTAMMPAATNPDLAIVIATLSCVVLIWLNSSDDPSSDTLTAKALASLPVRSVGLVSYSLYLWHWPVFVFFAMTVGLKSLSAVTSAMGVVAIVAVGSYFLVEKPFRDKRASFRRRTAPILGLTAAAILAAAFVPVDFGFLGSPRNWTTDWLPDNEFSYAGSNRIRAAECNLGGGAAIPVEIPADCTARTAQSSGPLPTVLIVGDSLAFADWGMLSHGFKQGVFQWSALSHDGCNINSRDDEMPPSCQLYWTTMPERIGRSVGKGDFVLVAVFWSLKEHTDYERAFGRLEQVLAATAAAGARVIVQAPLPQFGQNAFLCTGEWFRTDYEGCTIRRSDFDGRRPALINAFSALRANHPDALIWDPIDQLCDKESCRQFAGTHPLFRDYDHLSYWGSLSLGQAFEHFLTDIVQKGSASP